MKRLDSIKLKPVKETNAKVEAMGFKPLTDAVTAKEFLRRPEVSYQDVVAFIGPAAEELDDKIIELIETEIKYEGYISKAMDQVANKGHHVLVRDFWTTEKLLGSDCISQWFEAHCFNLSVCFLDWLEFDAIQTLHFISN